MYLLVLEKYNTRKMITHADDNDKIWIEQLFYKYREQLNSDFDSAWNRYVNNPRDYFIVDRDLRSFCHYYLHEDGTKSIREIAVETPQKGAGSALIKCLGSDIIVATYRNEKAKKFYKNNGFYEFGEVLDNKNREMVVYVKD